MRRALILPLSASESDGDFFFGGGLAMGLSECKSRHGALTNALQAISLMSIRRKCIASDGLPIF